MVAPASLEAWIGAVRSRLLCRTVAYCWGAFLSLGLAATAVWLILGAHPGRPTSWLRWGLALLLAGAVGLTLFAVAARLRQQRGAAVKRLRVRHPALGEDLESVLELAKHSIEGSPLGGAFVRCHRERVEGRLVEVPPSSLIQLPGLGRLLVAVALLGSTVVLGVTLVPEAPARFHALLGLQGGPDPLPWVLLQPAARPLRVEVQPPLYTRLSPRVQAPTKGAIEVPEGSLVTVIFEAPHAVGAVRALLPGGEPGAGECLGDSIFRVRFTARRGGELILGLRDPSGVVWVGNGGPAFRILPDRPPGISLKPSQAVIRLEQAAPLDLHWESEDDYGITAVRLVYQVDESPQRRVELFGGVRFGEGRKVRARGRHSWDLPALRLGPGDLVRFHLESEDNRSLPGARGGAGRTATPDQEIRIEGSAVAREDVIEGVRPLLTQALTALADRYERFWIEARPLPCGEQLRELERQRGQELVLSTSFSAFVERVRAQSGSLPPLLGEVFEGPLRSVAKRLATVTLADRAHGLKRMGPDCLTAHRPTGGQVVESLEELALQLDALTGRATLEEMKDVVQRADQLRKEIRRLAEQLRQRPDEATRKELATRTAELSKALARLSRLAGSLGDEVMDEHVNRYALREGDRRRIFDGLSRQSGGGASDPLGALDRMVSQLEEAVSQGIDRFRQVMPIAGEEARGRHADALRSLADRQRGLQGVAGGASDTKVFEKPQRELAQEAKRLAGSEPGKAGKARRTLVEGPGGPGKKGEGYAGSLEGAAKSLPSLSEAAQRMEEAAAALGRGDRQAARRLGEAALGMLGRLQAEADRAGRLTNPAGAEGAGSRGAVDVPPAGGVLPRDLRESIQDAGRALWPEPYREVLRRYYERLLR